MGDNKMLELPAGDPSALGFIPGRLNKISSMIDTEVDAGRLPGAATIVLRQGKVVHSHVSGKLDVERPASISTDTLFRLWSQTKPMTAVVLLALFEDGEFLLDEPVSKWIPEFSSSSVFNLAPAAEKVRGNYVPTEPARRDHDF